MKAGMPRSEHRVLSLNLGVDLGELLLRGCEAGFEPFHIPKPAFAFGLRDAIDQVDADLFQAFALGWVRTEHGAADAGVFMNA